MKTTSEILQDALLKGMHLTKFDFLTIANSVCLAQRVLELRQQGWNIRDKAVKGKGSLREYWLEPSEIERIKERFPQTKTNHEQSFIEDKNVAETPQNKPQIERYEQTSLLIGGRNY